MQRTTSGLSKYSVMLLAMAALTPCGVRFARAQNVSSQTHASTLPAGTPRSWVDAAAANEVHIIDDDGSFPLRYRVRKVDAKGDVTREVIETRQGSVARLVQRNGQPLTVAEDAAEQQRLNAILASPEEFIKHHKRDNATRQDSLQLVRQMPQAMIYTYTPGQPQTPNAASPQVVLDFHPDPAFKPPTMLSDLLTGLEGRMWIDSKSNRVTRIEGRVLHPVNFGWGFVARIYPGGTIVFEQANAGGDRWVYSHVDTHLTMRVIVKTVPMNEQMSAANFQLLPAPVSFQEAIHMLLAMSSPTH